MGAASARLQPASLKRSPAKAVSQNKAAQPLTDFSAQRRHYGHRHHFHGGRHFGHRHYGYRPFYGPRFGYRPYYGPRYGYGYQPYRSYYRPAYYGGGYGGGYGYRPYGYRPYGAYGYGPGIGFGGGPLSVGFSFGRW